MKLKPLHDRFIQEMKSELPDWRFVASNRHFRKTLPGKNLFVHIAFINHDNDFDATVNVAVEFVSGKARVCIVGASLGNIEGIGQFRYSVSSEQSAEVSALQAVAHLKRVGLPFLERYTSVSNTLTTLKAGGSEARLISPLQYLHANQIAALESIAHGD
jgi:hypothetical protein